MTLMAVKDGVFRAYAQSDNRGRRKRRGEFTPVSSLYPEFSGARTPVMREESEVIFPPRPARPAAETNTPVELCVRYADNGSGKMTLTVSGTLDLSTVLPFRDAVFTAIGNKPVQLVVDVTNVRTVDVAGISALVTVGRVAKLVKVSFSVSPSPSLKALLEETGIRLNVCVPDPAL